MDPAQSVTSQFNTSNVEIIPDKKDSSPSSKIVEEVKNLAQDIFAKYPPDSKVTKLNSTFEIKKTWLHSEWAPECQFSECIRPHFPDRSELDPGNKNPKVELIESTFDYVRGRWALWQAPREEGRWKKVEAKNLTADWIKNNVEVLYPAEDRFPVSELNGIVLWKEKSDSEKKYKLYEGNHRISAWLASQTPESLPAVIFIGKPKKQQKQLEAALKKGKFTTEPVRSLRGCEIGRVSLLFSRFMAFCGSVVIYAKIFKAEITPEYKK